MATYGQRPQDVLVDSRGNVLSGVVLKIYSTEALALAGGTPDSTATTDDSGRWTYTTASSVFYVRTPGGFVWEVTSTTGAVSTVAGRTGDVTIASTDITDSTSTGRSVLTAADAATARTAIGAGTSDLAIGTTASTAKVGNYAPASTDISDSTTTGRSVLTAASASAARTAIGAIDNTAASTSASGIVELATNTETTTGTDTARATTPAGVAAALAAADYRGQYVGLNAQTGTTYTAALSDVGKLVTCTNASAITVTLPQDSSVAFSTGDRVDFAVLGAGMVTFAADAGSTVNGTPSLVTRAQYSAATAIKTASNTWLVIGDLA